ncbi:MAG: class I SAM-dependent methyltransferase [Verrucomicrobiota bacterium]
MNIPSEINNRLELWVNLLDQYKPRKFAEVGVWKGEFAETILKECPYIEEYTMIDPWAHLPDWNKPFNKSTKDFTSIYEEAMERTKFASDRVTVLRGRTKDVIHEIKDQSLDFVYIDGDHTLRGIAIDLIQLYPKVKKEGIVAGDDFSISPWQHSGDYEPSLVCPFAVYFAEAMQHPITVMPFSQFLIEKKEPEFAFNDTTGKYHDLGLNKLTNSQGGGILRTAKRMIKKAIK